MDQRIMVRISAREESFSLRTFSRRHPLSRSFIILRKKLGELEEKKYVIVSDISSFAELRLCSEGQDIPVLEIRFSWLRDCGCGKLAGEQETVRLFYNRFKAVVEESERQEGKEMKMLTILERFRPKIEFKDCGNLKDVVENRAIRRKLGKFLDRHFNWRDSDRIIVTDDFAPYSFFFTEMRGKIRGICGGIILHGQEDLKKAYYGMHT